MLLKEALGKSVGRRTGMPRTVMGRGQADLRRGEPGRVRNTGQSPLSVIGEPRISDDRALKVAREYPGRPAASRRLQPENYRVRG